MGFNLFLIPPFTIFSEYPQMRSYRNKRLAPIIFTFAIVLYGVLTVWNVLTQGYLFSYTSQALPSYNQTDKSVTCQAATLTVGNTYYTGPPGSFPWSITDVHRPGSVESFENAVTYTGAPLQQCEVLSVGLTYEFAGQSFVYGVCANCTAPKTKDAELSTLRLCSNFDLGTANLPGWTQATQQVIQNSIYTVGGLLPQINLPNGSLPLLAVPPYGQQNVAPPNDTTITPASAYRLNFYINSFTYSIPYFNATNGTYAVNGTAFPTFADVFSSIVLSSRGNSANTILNALGVGAVRIGGAGAASVFQGTGLTEPAIITSLRTAMTNSVDLLVQRAALDLEGRSLSVGYLCSIKRKVWKDFWPMLAVILGNNSALFGLALATLLLCGRFIDEGRMKKRANSMMPDLETPRRPRDDNEVNVARPELRTVTKSASSGSVGKDSFIVESPTEMRYNEPVPYTPTLNERTEAFDETKAEKVEKKEKVERTEV